jgi:antitoxin (DNA-binding transcriptional repressor) of toxin-antitoxin stability system
MVFSMITNHKNFIDKIEIDEIERNFPSYFHRVEDGETLIILKGGKPMAEIKPVISAQPKRRPFGLCNGDFVVPDDFDKPLPEEIIQEFEGK